MLDKIIKYIKMMLKKLKKYLVGTDSETFAVSLVDQPAIEENFLYFKKQEGEKLEVALESQEKHMVYGAVLVPNRPIYRRNEETGEEYYVEFTSDSIEKMSQDYLKNFRQFNVTAQHEEETPEVCMVESWLKCNMQYDKSLALGLNPDLPTGTWFCGMRVNNIDTWERIKSGELRGFSVESMISLEEVDFSKVEAKMEEEQPVEQPENDHIEAPETPQNADVVEQPIEEKIEPVVEHKEEPSTPQPEPQEEPQEEPKPNPLEELIKNLQSELNALKETNSQLVEKVKDLSQMPSARPVNTVAGNGGGNGDSYSQWREQMAKYL